MAILSGHEVGAAAPENRAPRLAAGTELLGEYQDSGYQTPKYLICRADGQVLQLSRLLYLLADALDGREAGQIATSLSAELGQDLTADHVTYLVEERLRPAGLVDPYGTDADGANPAAAPTRSDPLLALRYRVGVVPARISWRIAGVFRRLFARPAWIAVLGAFVTLDLWVVLQGDLMSRLSAGATTLKWINSWSAAPGWTCTATPWSPPSGAHGPAVAGRRRRSPSPPRPPN